MKTIISKNEEKNTVEVVDWLENIVRESARKMIAAALEDEVEQFIQQHLNRKDAEGGICLCMGRRRLLQCSWLEVLRELKSRGLAKAPKLAICDGALGFQQFVPGLDSIPDFDKIVKDFINHFKKKDYSCYFNFSTLLISYFYHKVGSFYLIETEKIF